MDLSVEIPRKAVRYLGSIKLQECLEKFIEPERMVATGFKCSKCRRQVDIEKDLTIYRFPKILVIHLKRFYHSAMRREKLNTTVNFPETLDMTAFSPHSSKSLLFKGRVCFAFLQTTKAKTRPRITNSTASHTIAAPSTGDTTSAKSTISTTGSGTSATTRT